MHLYKIPCVDLWVMGPRIYWKRSNWLNHKETRPITIVVILLKHRNWLIYAEYGKPSITTEPKELRLWFIILSCPPFPKTFTFPTKPKGNKTAVHKLLGSEIYNKTRPLFDAISVGSRPFLMSGCDQSRLQRIKSHSINHHVCFLD